MTGLLESAVRKPSLVCANDRSVRSFSRLRRSPARRAIQRHRQVRSCCQGTLEYALLLVRFGLWRGTVVDVGCGAGSLSAALVEAGFEVQGAIVRENSAAFSSDEAHLTGSTPKR